MEQSGYVSVVQSFHTDSGDQFSFLSEVRLGMSGWGGGVEVDKSLPSRAKVMNIWRCTSD